MDKTTIDQGSPVEIGVPTPKNTVWFTELKKKEKKDVRPVNKDTKNAWVAFDRDDTPANDIFVSPNALTH